MTIFWFIVLGLSVLAGVALYRHDQGLEPSEPSEGYVYFLSTIGGADSEPPAPIKIGMTHRDPARERLPEIETMSPEPLEVLYSVRVPNPRTTEEQIHKELERFRLHGEWFERWPTMAFIDDLQARSVKGRGNWSWN